MLHTLGADRIRLLSNNPDKAVRLDALGVHITERIPGHSAVVRVDAPVGQQIQLRVEPLSSPSYVSSVT
jgi:GTP cyclohydrolase II